MFIKIFIRSFFQSTLPYKGRSIHEGFIEKFEYSFLFACVEEIRTRVQFITNLDEQRFIVQHFGRIVLLLDDLLETSEPHDRKKLIEFVYRNTSLRLSDRRFIALSSSLAAVRPYIDRLSDSKKKTFWNHVSTCYRAETIPVSFDSAKREKQILLRSERKGGAFILSLVFLLDPLSLSKNLEKAIYYGGAWAQSIDDYFDSTEDRERSIETIFSQSKNLDTVIELLSEKYSSYISKYARSRNFLIPMGNDIVVWVKRFKFLSPILHSKI